MIDYNENLLKAKEHWEKEAGTWEIGRGIHWVENIAVQNRINLKVSGRLDQDPYQWLIGFLKAQRSYPVERCLTLGCGTGELERGLQKYQFSKIYDAFDIADLSINIAQKIAKNNNINTINYKVVDINNLTLAPNTYDVVFGIMSVHHFLNLEHIFSEVKKP
jgi:2-polyprenyl-3-methyl-5-hydroxy-6-metoxy-1,4-benzoquinol methylase